LRKPRVEELPKASDLSYILRGTVLALVISLLVCLLLSLVLFLTPVSERVVPYAVYITSIFSIIIGSAYAAKRIQSKGWLNGGITGLTFILVLLVLTKVFGLDLSLNLHLFTKLVLAFVLGSIGGILGLNL
jgi:putative membrane protein (TIGR04086 family)